MRQKNLVSILLLLTIAACKKDSKQPTANANIIGKWALVRFAGNELTTVDVTSDQYPCLTSNTLTFNANGTEMSAYSGTDTCYVLPTHTKALSLYVGYPGEAPTTNTWSSNGNSVSLHAGARTSYGKLTTLNGKTHLTFTDTLITGTDTVRLLEDNVKL